MMGLSTMVSDAVGLNVWTKFLSRYPSPDILQREWLRDSKNVLEIVRPLGQPKQRKKIIEAAVKLGAKIPSQVSQLTQHPGIGETIAEKIVGYGFGKPALPLDSHGCKLIDSPCKLTAPSSKHKYLREKLKHIFDPSEWMEVHELLRLHGQSNGSTPETVINLWEQWRALLIQD